MRVRATSNRGAPEIKLAAVVRRAPAKAAASVTVEVVGARIAVTRGFDPTL